MKVTIIGSGNVAQALAAAVSKLAPDWILTQICARNITVGKALAEKYGADFTDSPEKAAPSDIYIAAVSDKAVSDVCSRLNASAGAVVAHTCGGISIDAIPADKADRAVLYPLQTFSEGRITDFKDIPLFTEHSSAKAEEVINSLANALSDKVRKADSEMRNKLHIAAVFACNFTNYLYGIAGDMMYDAGLGYEVLKPLIRETAEKALATDSPASVQTGPAIRHDLVTLERHIAMLEQEGNEDNLKIYKLLSNCIWETLKKT